MRSTFGSVSLHKCSLLDSFFRKQDKDYSPLEAQEAIPVIGLRCKIAQKMLEAKRRNSHFTYVEEVDATELEALRTALQPNNQHHQTRGHLTLLPLLIRATVLAVPAQAKQRTRHRSACAR